MTCEEDERLAVIRESLPPEQTLWDALLNRVAYWSAPANQHGAYEGVSPTEQMTVRLAFGATEWREFLTRTAASRLREPAVPSRKVDDLDWQAIDDQLQNAIDAGYPWLGLTPDGLVGLAAPDDEPWGPLPDPAEGAVEPGGAWSPEPSSSGHQSDTPTTGRP